MDYEGIKIRVAKILKAQNKTAKTMCVSLGVTPQGYAGFFRDKTLRMQHILDIAAFLGADWRELLGMNESEPVNVLNEPTPSYGKKYLEQRVADLEGEMHVIRKELVQLMK